jgi:hypothetical protein
VFGFKFTEAERRMLRSEGGLNIPIVSAGGDSLFQSSVAATSHLIDAILADRAFEIEDHHNCLESARRELDAARKASVQETVAFLNECGEDGAPVNLSPLAKRAMERRSGAKSLGWLCVPGSKHAGFALGSHQFQDGAALAFQKEMHEHTDKCVHCDFLIGTASTPAIRHLKCRSSGLRTKQHHEVNHFLYSVSSQAYNQVQKEVVVKERSTVLEADGQRPSLMASVQISPFVAFGHHKKLHFLI